MTKKGDSNKYRIPIKLYAGPIFEFQVTLSGPTKVPVPIENITRQCIMEGPTEALVPIESMTR